jgi:2-polyprenyl-6-methoxyphenol hydroxylase-like FAD-dependent oxidoreductase
MAASTGIGRRAIVVGASMAGLTAAGALAEFFERVVVLERDSLPSDAAHRAGTPQSRHLHALLAGGQRALAELFPGFEQDLAGAGAIPLRVALDVRVEMPGYDPFPERDFGRLLYSMSRPLIERVVRQRVQQLSNVELRERCRVRDVVASPDGAAVTAVRCEEADGKSETLLADLVVDASGRGNITLGLLEAIGQPLPEQSVIGIDMGYATALFAIPDGASADLKGLMLIPRAPETSRGAFLAPLEGGKRWIVTLAGRYAEKPPGDADGFLDFAQQLRTPTLYDAIRHAEPLGDVTRYGFPASVWRHFERLARFPRGFIPFGDAICRFNPVYGQGMSVAAKEAVLLRQVLGSGEGDSLAALAASFFSEAAAVIETPWTTAAIPDFAMPQTNGERLPDLDRRLKFGRALTRLAAGDSAVHDLLLEVRGLVKPGSALRDPDLVERVEALMDEA